MQAHCRHQGGKKNNMISYLEAYQQRYAPKLKEIDILLKMGKRNIPLQTAAELLSVDIAEIWCIMEQNGMKKITSANFIQLMRCASGELCRMFKRELERGRPYTYTPDDIAYIYGLDKQTVKETCCKLHLKEVTAYTMPFLFSLIPVEESAVTGE